jgi:hypothetical protein
MEKLAPFLQSARQRRKGISASGTKPRCAAESGCLLIELKLTCLPQLAASGFDSKAMSLAARCYLSSHINMRLPMARAASPSCGRNLSAIVLTLATLATHVRLMQPTISSPTRTGTAIELRPSSTRLRG